MPNIAEYNAPIGIAPQAVETGIASAREAASEQERMGRVAGEAVSSGARAVGGAAVGVGQATKELAQTIDKHLASQAISRGSVAYSQLFGNLTTAWNQTASKTDPNNTSIAQGFSESQLEPALQKFQQAFENEPESAQRWALQRADDLRQHFTVKMSADMGVRAADAVQQNIQNSVANYSVLVGNDPTALPHAIESFRADLKAQLDASPYLNAEQVSQIHNSLAPKTELLIAKTAGDAMGKANPDAYINAINKGDFDQWFNGEQKIEAIKYAEGVKRANIEDENRQYELKKRQENDQQMSIMNGYLTDAMQGKGGHVLQEVASNTFLTPAQRENVVSFVNEHTRQMRENLENAKHPGTYRSLLNDLWKVQKDNPENLSIQPIRDAYLKGQISSNEEQALESRFASMDKPMEQNYHAQMSHVEFAVRNSVQYIGQPELAADALNRFDHDSYHILTDARNKGEDVRPLLDPASPKYLFSPSRVQTYLQPVKQAMSDQAAKVAEGQKIPAPAGAIAYLKAHPESKEQFKAQFGYLPEE